LLKHSLFINFHSLIIHIFMVSLIVHGGAWDIPDAEVEAHRKGCLAALKVGWDILKTGGSAIDAVEQTIRKLEDDETFDAGYGSHLNQLGMVELDASIMVGTSLRCGAVAAVHRVRNPISLARTIMEKSEHVLLVGEGAERFAAEYGISLCDPKILISTREQRRWNVLKIAKGFATRDAFRKKGPSDTVGAVARDAGGEICAGNSTGGTINKYVGRVGDSPLIGCGTYADKDIGGVSTTGWGEAIIKIVMAKTVIDFMNLNGGLPQPAIEKALEQLYRKVNGYGGAIALNKDGAIGLAYNTPRMARAYMTNTMSEPIADV
jgi:beta-aspartyl-peptidase (threonine type)